MNAAPPLPQRPRVLQVVTRLGLGGAEAVALSLARALLPQCDFVVFAVRGVGHDDVARAMQAELRQHRVPLYCGPNVSQKFGGMILAGAWMTRALRSFSPTIIHLHTEIPEAAYAAATLFSSTSRRSVLVRTIHNSVYWHFWPRLGRWCERRMPRSHVAAVSQDALAAYHKFRDSAHAGPLPSPPVVIYNGVPEPSATSAPRTRHRKPRVLFAGRFEHEKGTDLLPEIFRALRPPADGGELVLHGHGNHARRLQAFAADPPPGWIVEVKSPIPNLAGRFPEYDLVIMPSRFEGLGLVAIEASLAGVPVVATDGPGIREALPDDHPWRARAGDALSFTAMLQDALDHPEKRPAVAARANAFARERFSVHAMSKAYRELYQRALVP